MWRLLLDQFRDFMVCVLIVAAIVSGVIGEVIDTLAILTIVVINAAIGCAQQYRAERAMEALRELATPLSKVRRGGYVVDVDSRELVPGDIVLLEAGNVVSADIRLLEARDLAVDESVVTGESLPVTKHTDRVDDADLPVGDRHNMAYRGTVITGGRGLGVVADIGMATEIGRIAAMLRDTSVARTPLQKRLAVFGRRLAIVILLICAVIFTSGVLRGEPLLLMLLTAVSLAVAAIPEALPAVVTASLAFGARKMTRSRALVRRLPAVETLGSVTHICADKTGTLTENRMSLERICAFGEQRDRFPSMQGANDAWKQLGAALALNNDTVNDRRGVVTGDPTEVALVQAAASAGYRKAELEQQQPRVAELPFDTDRKCMTTVHASNGEYIAFTKGAPEQVLARCTGLSDRDVVLKEAEALAAQGFRVLAVACRTWSSAPPLLDAATIESELRFLGLVGLLDPPRSSAVAAVRECIEAGITPVMITGDHPATAMNIAQRVGIATDQDIPLTGPELASLSESELQARVSETRVYARVSPEQKIDIVQALQARGEFVAMTGDGVNDAPALKRADIGVAMGLAGTDVAREASDMVLLDDNFATIVAAVREGRRIYDNIRKFVKYTMTSNAGELWVLLLPPFLGLPIALLPIHILWINLVTDGLPGLALAAEPAERGIMRRAPRPPGESLFARGNWQRMIWVGLLIGGLSVFAEGVAIRSGLQSWQTIVFTVLTFAQLANALAIRSDRDALHRIGLRTNKPLLAAVTFTVALQLMVIYTPALQPVFKTQALTLTELAACVFAALLVFVAVELDKYLARLRSDTYLNDGSECGDLQVK